LQAGGRRFDPGWLHWRSACSQPFWLGVTKRLVRVCSLGVFPKSGRPSRSLNDARTGSVASGTWHWPSRVVADRHRVCRRREAALRAVAQFEERWNRGSGACSLHAAPLRESDRPRRVRPDSPHVARLSHKQAELCRAHNSLARDYDAVLASAEARHETTQYGTLLDQPPPRGSSLCDLTTTS
jgi:hypothetical protein